MEEANLTRKVRSERKDFRKTPMFPHIPWKHSCCSVWCRQVVSYAFSRSKKTANTDSRRANAEVISVSAYASGLAVLLPRRNPNWFGDMIWWYSRYHINLKFIIRSINLHRQLVRAMGR